MIEKEDINQEDKQLYQGKRDDASELNKGNSLSGKLSIEKNHDK